MLYLVSDLLAELDLVGLVIGIDGHVDGIQSIYPMVSTGLLLLVGDFRQFAQIDYFSVYFFYSDSSQISLAVERRLYVGFTE